MIFFAKLQLEMDKDLFFHLRQVKFLVLLNLYLKNKDTSVFDDEELFAIYDSIMLMCKKWRELFKSFTVKHPKSAKIKTKGNWAKKYYARCFALKKERGIDVITEDICNIAFSELMIGWK